MGKFEIRDIILLIIGLSLMAGIYLLRDIKFFPFFVIVFLAFCVSIYTSKSDFNKKKENWIYNRVHWRWKLFCWKKITKEYTPIVSLFISLIILFIFLISIFFLLVSLISLQSILQSWVSTGEDIQAFSSTIANFFAVIIVLFFAFQTILFYFQYRYMKEPEKERISPLWISARDNSGENYSIVLNNGGDVPVFNMEHVTSEVSAKDRLLFPKIIFEELNKGYLQRLDAQSEKMIFELPFEKFQDMRLFVVLDAKSLGGHRLHLFFYKPPDALDFDLVKVKYVRPQN